MKKFLVMLCSVFILTGVCQAADYSWQECAAFTAIVTTSFLEVNVMDDDEPVVDQQVFIYRMHRIYTPTGDDFAVFPWQKGVVGRTNCMGKANFYSPWGRYLIEVNDQDQEIAANGYWKTSVVNFDLDTDQEEEE